MDKTKNVQIRNSDDRDFTPKTKRDLQETSLFENKWLIFATFTILILAFIISFRFSNRGTSLEITPSAGRFRLDFQISKSDQDNFFQTLEELSLPQSIKDGVEFELDATSSFALAFAAPIKANVNFKTKQVRFNGSVNANSLGELTPESFKLPASTKLAIFAPDVKSFVNQKLNITPENDSWLSNLFLEKGQVLAFWGDKNEFFIITKASQVNIDELANIKIATDEQFYKKDQVEGSFEIHLLKLPKNTDEEQTILSIFQLGPWVFLAFSPEASQEIIQVQKSQKPSIDFPKNTEKSTLVVLFRNLDQSASESISQLFDGKKEWLKTFENVKDLEFVLKGNTFSGLINLK